MNLPPDSLYPKYMLQSIIDIEDENMVLAGQFIPDTLITNYLEMTSNASFQPAYINNPDIEIVQMQAPDLTFYRFLYSSVGGEWRWRDRLLMSDEELQAALDDPATSVHVMYVHGAPAGYVELAKQDDGSVEIAYFGLRAEYMGRGLGKHLLSYGIESAWKLGANRIWLHTCNLDSPHALANYQKRGFKVFHTDTRPMPERYLH